MFACRLLVVVLSVSCVCAGCQKTAEEAMERAIESQIASDGGKANVEIKEDSISMQVQGADGNAAINIGEGAQIPKGFPNDVPVYPKMTVVMSQSQNNNDVFVVQANSGDSVEKVATYYEAETAKNGWKQVHATALQGGKTKILGYEKDGCTLQVAVAASDDGTSISITTASKD